jgi:hypothetical protein
MRRLIAILVLLVATLVSATPAEAFHRHWGWRGGWGHPGWGHRGWGWGGVGWGHRGWGWGHHGWGYRGYGWNVGFRGGPAWGWGNAGWVNPGWGWGNQCFGMGQPVIYSPGFYTVNSPWFFAANQGGMNFNVPADINLPASVNNPMYASSTRGPIVTLIATTARSGASASFAAAPSTATRPVGGLAANTRFDANTLQQFLGMNELRPINLIDVRMAMNPEGPVPPTARFPARVSNVESRRKAERIIAEADELFKGQNFNSALQRYKLAASTAPDLPEAYWRQGHALIATRNYALAATAFKRAIALADDLGRGGFRLNDIYGGAMMTKSQHLESLAEWAISKRDSADSYFLLGLFFEYDGQPARAKKFFQKASDLAGISGGHIGVFLEPGEPVLLRTIERSSAKSMPAKPSMGIPVIVPSANRDI